MGVAAGTRNTFAWFTANPWKRESGSPAVRSLRNMSAILLSSGPPPRKDQRASRAERWGGGWLQPKPAVFSMNTSLPHRLLPLGSWTNTDEGANHEDQRRSRDGTY